MTDLSKAERRWLEADNDRPPPRPSGVITSACHDIGVNATRTAAALINATCTLPPQRRTNQTPGRSSDVADRVLSQIESTVDTIDRAMFRFAHLLDNCLICDDEPTGHNDPWTITLATLTGSDWTHLTDHAAAISGTQRHAIATAAQTISEAFRTGSIDLKQHWFDLRRAGAEPDQLRDLAQAAARLSRQLLGLSDSLAQWRPGILVRLCACNDLRCCPEGAKHPAPQKGEGATCQACRTTQSRLNRAMSQHAG